MVGMPRYFWSMNEKCMSSPHRFIDGSGSSRQNVESHSRLKNHACPTKSTTVRWSLLPVPYQPILTMLVWYPHAGELAGGGSMYRTPIVPSSASPAAIVVRQFSNHIGPGIVSSSKTHTYSEVALSAYAKRAHTPKFALL